MLLSYCDVAFINVSFIRCYLALIISENDTLHFLQPIPFVITGSGYVSVMNTETIFYTCITIHSN